MLEGLAGRNAFHGVADEELLEEVEACGAQGALEGRRIEIDSVHQDRLPHLPPRRGNSHQGLAVRGGNHRGITCQSRKEEEEEEEEGGREGERERRRKRKRSKMKAKVAAVYLLQLLLADVLPEGEGSHYHLVHQDSGTPEVALLAVVLHYHLRGLAEGIGKGTATGAGRGSGEGPDGEEALARMWIKMGQGGSCLVSLCRMLSFPVRDSFPPLCP